MNRWKDISIFLRSRDHIWAFGIQNTFFDISWLKIYYRQWLRARWKHIGKTLLLAVKKFKVFIFYGGWAKYGQITIFVCFGPKTLFWDIFRLKIIYRQWSKARWKPISNTLLVMVEMFKNFNFRGVWGQITMFEHLGPKTHFWIYIGLKMSI